MFYYFWLSLLLILSCTLLLITHSSNAISLEKLNYTELDNSGSGESVITDSYEYGSSIEEPRALYSEEDLENVTDGDGEATQNQSRFFMKTLPRKVFSSELTGKVSGIQLTTGSCSNDKEKSISPTSFPTIVNEDFEKVWNSTGSEVEPMKKSIEESDEDVETTDSSLSIPGVAGLDYPIFSTVPKTGFDCQKQRYKGFFADLYTNCQAWHYCDLTDGHSTFLCPNGTLFSQVLLTCDWWFNVNCPEAEQLYVLNERLYGYVPHPKPTFPEDFHGPEVDLWLKRQLQLGILPKISENIRHKNHLTTQK